MQDIVAALVVVGGVVPVFAACCASIARASFYGRPSRAEVMLAFFRAVAFALAVCGCLAFSEWSGPFASAVFSVAFCIASLVAGCALGRAWRRGEREELRGIDELRQLVDRYREEGASVESRCARAAREYDLTRREEEVLALLLEGCSRSEIARELYVSGDTVKSHVRNLYRKMGVSGKDELVDAMTVRPQERPRAGFGESPTSAR